ncbi:oocyte zinc finger protein XlCOF28-like isoform X1 [Acanthopagrus latus]|uniref:oocyte zinc finger protein XlCOF28-like isoform X1 n=1 Tax=Acanthopagrus latus TaxID=8177 RepID=UPI00187BDE23|nr:oocyte zinc finger protein XlCOF28-like isoform X1 [Acanthopagrus latus]
MGQIDEVSERLNAFTSEIVGVIEKTLSDYEAQASRLKEENDRHRCLLDIIVKAKLPETEAQAAKNDASPCASDPTPPPRRHRDPPRHTSGDLQCVFTSQTNFMKFAGDDNCPYCIRSVQASEKHLMKKHFLSAVHFVAEGTEQFVVPCMCKDKIQKGRSHWHCPCCRKILFRKCNFEMHLSKQHRYVLLLQRQDEVQVKPEGVGVDVDHGQCSAINTVSVGSNVQAPIQSTIDSSEEKTEDWKKRCTPSHLKAPSSKRKKRFDVKKSTELPVSQSPTDPHCCKACGKTFLYMHMLRTHVHTHAEDKNSICGICGKRSESRLRLIQHLQNHTRGNKCVCGKQFSNTFRLKKHRRCHRP